ncbi:hypothetical protein PROFUN_16130 [Planoprotostelium fungivorum]|uniref:Uncharacterized protein n=1 Tax=Planoprotostelium fungivorum TaxID=1890364 RepID=A0A2P6MS66_9EUKA|nr:hypothetical protein PROFUN_16130 [Planoprotostelium fungivorum]
MTPQLPLHVDRRGHRVGPTILERPQTNNRRLIGELISVGDSVCVTLLAADSNAKDQAHRNWLEGIPHSVRSTTRDQATGDISGSPISGRTNRCNFYVYSGVNPSYFWSCRPSFLSVFRNRLLQKLDHYFVCTHTNTATPNMDTKTLTANPVPAIDDVAYNWGAERLATLSPGDLAQIIVGWRNECQRLLAAQNENATQACATLPDRVSYINTDSDEYKRCRTKVVHACRKEGEKGIRSRLRTAERKWTDRRAEIAIAEKEARVHAMEKRVLMRLLNKKALLTTEKEAVVEAKIRIDRQIDNLNKQRRNIKMKPVLIGDIDEYRKVSRDIGRDGSLDARRALIRQYRNGPIIEEVNSDDEDNVVDLEHTDNEEDPEGVPTKEDFKFIDNSQLAKDFGILRM